MDSCRIALYNGVQAYELSSRRQVRQPKREQCIYLTIGPLPQPRSKGLYVLLRKYGNYFLATAPYLVRRPVGQVDSKSMVPVNLALGMYGTIQAF